MLPRTTSILAPGAGDQDLVDRGGGRIGRRERVPGQALAATLAVATWAPLANAVTVPCPARLTATSATGVPSTIVHTAGSGGGSRNGHTRGLT